MPAGMAFFVGRATVALGRQPWERGGGLKGGGNAMIRKLSSGKFRLYSRKKDAKGKRKNLGTFNSKAAAQKHEKQVQYFKRAG